MKTSYKWILFSLFLLLASGLRCGCCKKDDYETMGSARRPLVLVSGQTEQLPTADYISTVGGLTTNATAATGAGDLQSTSAEISSNETVGGTLGVTGTSTLGVTNVGGAFTASAGSTLTNNTSVDSLNLGVIAPASLGSSQNDWNPAGLQTASLIQITASTQININGIVAPTGVVNGRRLCLQNISANTVSLVHASGGSSAANRFVMVGGVTWVLLGGSAGTATYTICFNYDSTASRWEQISAGTFDFPQLIIGSSATTISALGVIASASETLSGPSGNPGANVTDLGITEASGFNTTTGNLTSLGVSSSITSTRSSGANTLTNLAGYFNASGAQVNQALETDAGLVILNNTSGTTSIHGNIIQTGTPSVNHGSLGTGSNDWRGNVTGIGSNTSVTLTYSAAFTSRSWCIAQTNSVSISETIYVTNSSSAPVFNCINSTTGVAANCNDFTYDCVGQ